MVKVTTRLWFRAMVRLRLGYGSGDNEGEFSNG
jgi:hypothetical protein